MLFFNVALPTSFDVRATALKLSSEQREAARRRVKERTPASDAAPIPAPGEPTASDVHVLVIDREHETAHAAKEAFGETTRLTIDVDPYSAFWKAIDGDFDLILCSAQYAFGKHGVLAELRWSNVAAACRTVILAHEGERELVISNIEQLGRRWTSFLCKPIDAETLRMIVHTGAFIQSWRLPVWGARPKSVRRARVVIVDDHASMEEASIAAADVTLDVEVVTDEWEAVERVSAPDVALVLCSAALRTVGGSPFYRLLWNANPDIKRRFAFIVNPDAVPPSATVRSEVVTRPLRADVIRRLVEQRSPGRSAPVDSLRVDDDYGNRR